MKKKLQQPIWFSCLIVLMFFVIMGIVAGLILGRYDDISGVIKGAAFMIGISEFKRMWGERK